MSGPVSENGTPWHQLPGATGGIRVSMSPRPVPQLAALEKIFLTPFARIAAGLTGGDPEDWDTIDEIIDNILGGLGADFEELLAALQGNYSGSDLVLGAIQQVASGFRSVLSGGPLINFGQLTATPVNLLPSGSFDTDSTVLDGEGWAHDPAVGRSAAGSARFVGTGEAGILFSPGPAEVEASKAYAARCYVRWDGVVASGAAFTPFVRWSDAQGGLLSESALPGVSAPAASSSWVELAAEVTAPAGARWAHLAFRVEAGVLGTVWWDDAAIMSAQTSLPQQVIAGLTDALGRLGDDVADALAWIKDLIEKLTGRARASIEDAIGDVLAFGSQLKTILSGGTVASPLPNLAGSAVREAQTMIQQIAAIANGDPVTPVNGIVQAFKDGWSGLSSLTAGVESWLQDLIDALLRAIRKVPVVGGSLADIIAEVGGLNDRTDAAQGTADAVQAGITEGWVGGSAAGADQDVYDTMAAIKALVGGDGYTRVNITSTTTWAKPAGTTEVIAVGIAAGQNGGAGSKGGSSEGQHGNGGPGGFGGGHKVQALDPAGFAALHVTIGANGSPTLFRADTSSGAILMEAIAGGAGAMATQFGYTGSNSQAGGGGGGGAGNTGASSGYGIPGQGSGGGVNGVGRTGGQGGASAAALGGASGGGAGASVTTTSAVPCGGGGGGGGNGSAGNGGAGGFPGGGGGGGAGSSASIGAKNGGSGGAGGAGLGIIFYR